MPSPSRAWLCGLIVGLMVGTVVGAREARATGPFLDLAEPLVAPGESEQVTLRGDPGAYYVLSASRADRGLVVEGRTLQLGPDAQVVASGRLDTEGWAVIDLAPDFTVAPKLYLQAVTAATPTFAGFVPTPGKALRALPSGTSARLVEPVWIGESGEPDGTGSLGPQDGVGRPLARLAGTAPAPVVPLGGRGGLLACLACVATSALADGAVTRAKLASDAAWFLAGNAGTNPATQFLGTTDAQPLELRVKGQRALRLESPAGADPSFGTGPNLLGGLALNTIAPGVVGATIAGGGADCPGFGSPCPNRITDHFGTIGGGLGNQAGDDAGDVADGAYATVGGGLKNAARAISATVGGGQANTARNVTATIAGGDNNTASGDTATVAGGGFNRASGAVATVGGGAQNTGSGAFSTVPGGFGAVAALHGQLAHAAGSFGVEGDAQWAVYTLRRETVNNLQLPLFLDGGAQPARLTVAPGRALAFDGLVVARRDNGLTAGFRVQGVIRNNAGTTVLLSGSSVASLGDEALAGWSVAVQADDANDALVIGVAGATGQTIHWVAVVRTVEVAF